MTWLVCPDREAEEREHTSSASASSPAITLWTALCSLLCLCPADPHTHTSHFYLVVVCVCAHVCGAHVCAYARLFILKCLCEKTVSDNFFLIQESLSVVTISDSRAKESDWFLVPMHWPDTSCRGVWEPHGPPIRQPCHLNRDRTV